MLDDQRLTARLVDLPGKALRLVLDQLGAASQQRLSRGVGVDRATRSA